MRGTRPYWNGKRANLETYVHSLSTPSAFLTFSAADYHWDSLHRCYGPRVYNAWKNGTPTERMQITRESLRDNPHIAAYHFHRRFLALMDCVITPKFGVTDYWNRYEFQSRGSSHNHGFIWCRGGPELDLSDEASRKEFADYWGVYVSAVLPAQIERQLEERTAMALSPDEDRNTIKQLATLVGAL